MIVKKSEATRRHIMETGRKLIAEQGFSGMGLSTLLKSAGVPKGSFYHYFESKEYFGCVLVQQYLEEYMAKLDELFEAEGKTMREKLFNYWKFWQAYQWSDDPSKHCLIVKLSAEVADISADMSDLFTLMISSIERRLQVAIQVGIDEGSIAASVNAEMTAKILYQMWLGASLIGKVTGRKDALQKAFETTERMLPAAYHQNIEQE